MTASPTDWNGAVRLKTEDVLSFKSVGRPIRIDDVADEFMLMKSYLKNPLTAAVAGRVCQKSGSHLLKMVSARTDGDQACLYFEASKTNERPKIIPAVDAKDIPFCKVLYRLLEIVERSSRSVIDEIMNPDDISNDILDAFASVFGQEVLDAVRDALLYRPKRVIKLAAGEFPIIFAPRPDRSDLQITPVSPATSFMGVKSAIDALYERKSPLA